MFASALPRECRPIEICVEIRKNVKKLPQHYQSQLKETSSDFNNFWSKYFQHHWLLNDSLSSHLTQLLLLHYLGKTDQANRVLK